MMMPLMVVMLQEFKLMKERKYANKEKGKKMLVTRL
jgi:hypothetical protein